MSDWRPIETAPKTTDNYVAVPILAFCPDEHDGKAWGSDDRIRVVWWEPGLGCWYDDRDIKGKPPVPSHWMPLPAPPAPPATREWTPPTPTARVGSGQMNGGLRDE